MLLKLAAYIVFIVPIIFISSMVSTVLGYKGPIVLLYVIGALGLSALCLWPVFNIFRGTSSPWSVTTWIFLAIDICLGLVTIAPWPLWRR